MALVSAKFSRNLMCRWAQTLHGLPTIDMDLGAAGNAVGPRRGPNKRNHGEKEDYTLRRLLVALGLTNSIPFPVHIRANADLKDSPDFVFSWPNERYLGVEITEAGDEHYQAWLTQTEIDRESGRATRHDVPDDASTPETARQLIDAIRRKVSKYDDGSYRQPTACDLAVYDNTAWGGFLDKREVMEVVGAPNELSGRFRQVHLVFESHVCLDVFGRRLLIARPNSN